MNKQIYIVTFILIILLSMTVSAETNSIILKSPGDDTSIITYTQDFIFSFAQHPDMINCSLIVDEEVKKSRNVLLKTNNNKLSLELEAGAHEWYIMCVDNDFNEIVSETRSLSVNVGGEIKAGYETVYYSTGLRGYILTIAPGQSPVELPALKAGEDIQIKIGGNTYFLDIIKMGASGDTSFVEVRDRTKGVIHRMLVPSTLSFDFDDDEIIDVELSLSEVERNINALFVVTPYPGSVVEEPEPEPVPEPEPIEEPVTEPVEEPEEPAEEPVVVVEPVEKPEPKKNYIGLIVLIVIIVIVIILVIMYLSFRSKEKVSKVKAKKKSVPKKKIKKVAEKEKPVETKPVETESSQDDWPVLNEEFDIIKAGGRKKKK